MSIARGGLETELLEARKHLGPAAGSRSARRVWTLLLLAIPISSLAMATIGKPVVNAAGLPQMYEFWRAAASPELGTSFLRVTFSAALTTLAYAILGSMLSILIGLAGGSIAARSSWATLRKPLRWSVVGGTRGLLSLPRGVHEVVWGLILINVLGADPLVGILAIGIPYGAITAKVFAEILDEAHQQPYLALRGAGAGRARAMLYGLFPVASGDMISYVFYRFECSIRAAAILGLIGAGGLGYELALSFRTLRYDEMWTLIYALIVLSGLVDLWSSSLRKRLSVTSEKPPRNFPTASALVWLGLCVVSAIHLQVSLSNLVSDRARDGFRLIAGGLWPPSLPAETWPALIRASIDTLEMSVIATAIAATLGAITSVLLSGGSHRPSRAGRVAASAPRIAAKGLLLLCRAIPPPVWALLLLFVLLPGVLPGALALGIYNFGILGRLMSEATENLEPAPRSALLASGASGPGSFLYGSAPRLASRYVALSLYRWEVTTRETVIVGLVGAGGLGRLLTGNLAAFDFARVSGVLITLIAITLLVDAVSAAARQAFR
ncbi:MAG: ABC transporter permease subunit [Actinobacteria bacterium]|nr:ABC transporter permease subunit [Actinomycetota bacterium]